MTNFAHCRSFCSVTFRADQRIDCGLPGDFGDQVCPTLRERAMANLDEGAVQTVRTDVVPGYLERDAVQILIDRRQCYVELEAAIRDYSIHGDTRTDAGNQADLKKPLKPTQLSLYANSEATATEGCIEGGVGTAKRTVRAARVRLNSYGTRKLSERNWLNNVVVSAPTTARSTFDGSAHFPAAEGLTARFHRFPPNHTP